MTPPEYRWVKGSLAGKSVALTGEQRRHVIESVDPRAYKVRLLCGLIADYNGVRVPKDRGGATPPPKCKTCEAKRTRDP